MREKCATELHPLQFRCPYCGAEPGQPCRTRTKAGRPGGRVQNHPHSRRIGLSVPVERRHQPTRLEALCCACGQLRTVSSDYGRYGHPDHSDGDLCRNANGWRRTEPLKCDECGAVTRHAVLNRPGSSDYDENLQRIALGGENTSGWSNEYIERLRRDYHAMFPRNPNLHHRFYVEDAQKAWDAGERTVATLCGTRDSIGTDPRTWGTSPAKKARQEKYDGFVVAEQISDVTEYEDPETGLWWVDMDCVDCCRVSNTIRLEQLRKKLEQTFARFAAYPELVPDAAVSDLINQLEKLIVQATEET